MASPDRPSRECEWCGRPLSGTARRRFCSDGCRQRAHRAREKEPQGWEWLEQHPGVVGELVGFGLVALLALGLSVGLIDRRGATLGLRVLARRQAAAEALTAPPPAPAEPRARTPLYLVDHGRLSRFWEA